jgi:hypothetical protein
VPGRRAREAISPLFFQSADGAAAPGRVRHRGHKGNPEMLDFCAEHGITADIELIRMQQINEAYDRLLKSDVKYRFVIDMASLK